MNDYLILKTHADTVEYIGKVNKILQTSILFCIRQSTWDVLHTHTHIYMLC